MNKSIKYLSLNNEIFYSLDNICNIFKLDYKKVKQKLSNNYICIKNANSNKYNIFINAETLNWLTSVYNHLGLQEFADMAIHNAFSENEYDSEQHCILLNM